MEDSSLLDSNSNLETKKIIQTIKLALLNIQNYLFIWAAEFFVDYEAMITTIYILATTLVLKGAIFLLCCYGIDKIETFLTGAKPTTTSKISWLDRGFAFLASFWTMSELFMYYEKIVYRIDLFYNLQQDYFVGMICFFNLHPLNNTIFTFFVFREIIRRRGPDTKWVGNETPTFWISNFIRYHWAFAFCLNIVVQTYMYGLYKFLIPLGFTVPQQVAIGNLSFSITLAIILYSGACALLGLRCRLPVFHGACVLHAGIPIDDPDGGPFK